LLVLLTALAGFLVSRRREASYVATIKRSCFFVDGDSMQCCVSGCPHFCADRCPPVGCEALCDDHLGLAREPALQTLLHARRRLDRLERGFADPKVFDQVFSRGKHLQFCALIETAQSRVDTAWEALKRDVLSRISNETIHVLTRPQNLVDDLTRR
jgi:hypothetical protein